MNTDGKSHVSKPVARTGNTDTSASVRAGVSAEDWLQQQVMRQELEEYTPAPVSLQDELTPEEWVRQFQAWAEGHDRTTPLLSDEAISRENIYPDLV